MLRRAIFAALLLVSQPQFAEKLPDLDRTTTKHKLEEIMQGHVSHQRFDREVAERSLKNFIELTDPAKTYLLHQEVRRWIEPSPELLADIERGFERADFSEYGRIFDLMREAVARRQRLEQSLDGLELPKEVDPEEFDDLEWSRSEAELKERLLKLRALRQQVADKLEPDQREVALQRVEKRRRGFEDDFTSDDSQARRRQLHVKFLKAGASALDSQTAYFTPAEAQQFMIGVQQRLFGIGAQLRDDLNGFTIVKIIEGGPAERGGNLKENDRIIAVDGEPVVGMEITDAVQLIRGEAGTRVDLTVLRRPSKGRKLDGQTEERLDIQVVRGEVVLKEQRIEASYEPFGNGVLGYVKLYSFYEDPQFSSAQDLAEEIKRLKREHDLQGIVLDLRYNAGGLLSQAVEVTGLFISKGVVVSIKDNAGRLQRLRDTNSETLWDGPLIVLTNRASASAAEIVAQTLKDYGRAIVVGDDVTFGKGTFQTFTLSASGRVHPLGEYKVTRGRYYTVGGQSPQLAGVSPHLVVPGALSQVELGERFSKYPVPSDDIRPAFDDDLGDVPLSQRKRIAQLYAFNLQPRLRDYSVYMETLSRNSERRIEQNKDYQAFLKAIREDEDAEDLEEEGHEMVSDGDEPTFGQSDLQKMEAMNILKDLVYLMLTNPVDSTLAGD